MGLHLLDVLRLLAQLLPSAPARGWPPGSPVPGSCGASSGVSGSAPGTPTHHHSGGGFPPPSLQRIKERTFPPPNPGLPGSSGGCLLLRVETSSCASPDGPASRAGSSLAAGPCSRSPSSPDSSSSSSPSSASWDELSGYSTEWSSSGPDPSSCEE